MKSRINISIPEACHENWQAMITVEKGKFCGSCQKNVFDFTKATDRQIIEASNKDNKLCGRFLKTQLNRDLVTPKEKGSIWLATTSTLFSLLSFGNNEVKAQETPKTEQTETTHLLGKPAVDNNTKNNYNTELVTISGVVINNEDEFVSNLNIYNNGKIISCTNNKGGFTVKIPDCSKLLFFNYGEEIYEGTTYIANGNVQNIKIFCYKGKPRQNAYMGSFVIKRKTFLGRTFHKIGNWFK